MGWGNRKHFWLSSPKVVFICAVMLVGLWVFLMTLSPNMAVAGTDPKIQSARPEAADIELNPPPQGMEALPTSPNLIVGPQKRSLLLDGVNSYVRIPNGARFDPPYTGEITIEAWVWRNSASRCETVVGKGYLTSYWLGFCPDKIRFYAAGSGTAVDGNATIPAGKWTHIAVTYDGTTRKYYINGELDLETTTNNGSMVSNGADIGIGRDLVNNFAENNFSGLIDEVRIWARVRTQSEIQNYLLSYPWGIAYLWPFDGDADGGVHNTLGVDGTLEGNATFDVRGALPREVTMYNVLNSMTVDGDCTVAEYGGAEQVGIEGAVAYIQHDYDNLFVCIEGMEQGVNRFGVVAFDGNNSHDLLAQPGDYRFAIGIDGSTNAQEGDGAGGFVSLSPPPGLWEAARLVEGDFYWHAEFRIDKSLVTTWFDWSMNNGLYLAELGRAVGDLTWPVFAEENSPQTWGYGNGTKYGTDAPTATFNGSVLRQRDDAGIENATVRLLGEGGGLTHLLETTHTDSSGLYTLTYTGYNMDSFLVQETDPRGFFSVVADDGGDGNVHSPNQISYTGYPSDTVYSTATFIDTDARPNGQAFDRHYLIVYSEPVEPSDLMPLVELKEMQGFQVVYTSTQVISNTISGRDLSEKIRNWLKAQWQSHDPDPVYALLIGRHDVIPVRQVGWEGDNAHRTPEDDGFTPALLTDWYYADLDSDWDGDSDGFYGEYVYCAPWEVEVPSVPWPAKGAKLPCPSSDSPLREGPYGTDPDTDDDWKAEISIGRLMINERTGVRNALQTSVASEMSGSVSKHNALVGAAFWTYNGQYWDTSKNAYTTSGDSISGAWPGEGNQPYGNDSASHNEDTLVPILETYLYTVTTLYNTKSPGNDPALSPSGRTPDIPLTQVAMETEWQDQMGYGLVNVTGHGSFEGVKTQYWVTDWNSNRIIDNPAVPTACPSAPCWELSSKETLINLNMPSPGGIAPIVFANACSTGDAWEKDSSGIFSPRTDLIAGKLPAEGKVTAWIGGLSVVKVEGLNNFQDGFNESILGPPLLLGDALWSGMETLIGAGSDFRDATLQLFGDPTYAYWGNPGDLRAPWPQAGRDWFSTNATPFSGPDVGYLNWQKTNYTPKSPPVVDRADNIIVGGQTGLVKFAPDGTVLDSVAPGAVIEYSPAIATDGVYVVAGSVLYNYNTYLDLRYQTSLGGIATGAPRIGPDGIVWVPTSLGMTRITGVGIPEILGGGYAVGMVAFTPSGASVWTTGFTTLEGYFMDRRGNVSTASVSVSGAGALTAPAVGANGDIYFGTTTGYVVAVKPFPFHPSPQQWQYYIGGGISAKPAVGPDGTIYVGDHNGFVTAISSDGTLLWSQSLEGSSSPSILADLSIDDNLLYIAAGSKLYAMHPVTGETLWSLYLGGTLNAAGTPVIGSHRIYITRTDGYLVAVSEDAWLTTPSEVRVNPGSESAFVYWRDNSQGEAGFQVDRCSLVGICVEEERTLPNQTSLTIYKPPGHEPFYLRVMALGVISGTRLSSIDGIFSSDYGYSNMAYVLPVTPDPPSNLSASPKSSEEIRVTWTYAGIDEDFLTGFSIYRSDTVSGFYEMVGSTGPSQFFYVDGGLSPNTPYFYKVTAKNDAGPSTQAGPVNATTKSLGLPAPTNFVASSVTSMGIFTLSWQDNASSETGYVVERMDPGIGTYEFVAELPPNTTAYTDTYNLVVGQYTYRVKAVTITIESDYAYATDIFSVPHFIYLPLVDK